MSTVGVYMLRCPIYTHLRLVRRSRKCRRFSQFRPLMLFRLSRLVGCHVGLFLNGPES